MSQVSLPATTTACRVLAWRRTAWPSLPAPGTRSSASGIRLPSSAPRPLYSPQSSPTLPTPQPSPLPLISDERVPCVDLILEDIMIRKLSFRLWRRFNICFTKCFLFNWRILLKIFMRHSIIGRQFSVFCAYLWTWKDWTIWYIWKI